MKNLERTIIILKSVFITMLVVGLLFFVAYNETHYSKTGTVTQYDGISTFKDHHGNQYDFYADEIIPINANVQVKFYTNNTLDNIKDDELIDYKIIGYVDEVNLSF
jgi:hypothetical protein